MQRKKLRIIWDLDGTLIDSYDAIVHAFEELIKRRGGTPPPYEQLKAESLAGFIVTMDKYIPDCKGEEEFWPVERDFPHPFFSFAKTVLKIADENHICTNRYGAAAREILEEHNVMQYFTSVRSHTDGYDKKPSRDMYEAVLEGQESDGWITVVVGDRKFDLTPAKEMGLVTVAFGNPELTADYHTNGYLDFVRTVLSSILGEESGFFDKGGE